VVRWRDASRNRSRRFETEHDGRAFDATLRGQAAFAEPSGVAALEARLAELEARLAMPNDGAGDRTGVYAYETAQGRPWY
jgi:hypothetical protein